MTDLAWMRRGVCRDGADLWTPDDVDDAGRAIHQCLRHCPVLDRCAVWARQQHELYRWDSVVVAGVHYPAVVGTSGDRPTRSTKELVCGGCQTSAAVDESRRCGECDGPMPAAAPGHARYCGSACRYRVRRRAWQARYQAQQQQRRVLAA